MLPNNFDSFVDDLSLHIHAPPDNQATFVRARPGSGANDFGLCSVDDAIAFTEIPRLGISSDHLPVLFHIFSAPQEQEAEQEREVWNKKGDTVLYRELIKTAMPDLLQRLQLLDRKGPDTTSAEWDQLAERTSSILRDAGMMCFGKRTTVRATCSWSKSDEVRASFNKLKEAEAELINNTNNQTLHAAMQEARTEFHNLKIKKEDEIWSKIRNQIGSNESRKLLHTLLPDHRDSINLLDILKPHTTTPCSNKAEAAEVLVEHYAQVCSLPDDPSFSPQNRNHVEECINNIEHEPAVPNRDTDLIISEEEVSNACKKLNRHSAAGPDDIPPTLLIEGGQPLFAFLAEFFTSLLHHGYAPASFRLAHIFPIFKGERNDRASASSYRPISLTSIIAKTMERCLLPLLQSRIRPFLSPSQAGFRPGFSTRDQIYILSRAVQKALASHSTSSSSSSSHATLPVAFLDLSKAFDRVWIEGLLFKADKCGVKGLLWKWLKSFLSNRSIRVSTQGILSSAHAITAGVPQGSVLSPTLFLIFINDIADCCKGCTPALFADDIALWPRDLIAGPRSVGEAQLSLSLLNLSQWAADWRMIFNVKKSCIVFFQTKQRATNKSSPHHPDFFLCKEKLPQQEKFRYLGIIFHKNGRWNDHFNYILPKVRYATLRICRIIRKGLPPSLPIICSLIKTLVHPIISYGFPVVQFTKSQEARLNSLIIQPVKRSLTAFSTTSHAALFINSRLLDVHSLRKKTLFSYAHRTNKLENNPACFRLRDDIGEFDSHCIPATAPQSTRSFAEQIREIERDFGLSYDQHFSAQQLNQQLPPAGLEICYRRSLMHHSSATLTPNTRIPLTLITTYFLTQLP